MRPATLADLPDLGNVARMAKRHWGYPDEWIEEWNGVLAVSRGALESSWVMVAESAGRPVGFCAVKRDARDWSLEHMWVIPAFMRRGVGRALLRAALVHVKAEGGTTLTIESDPNAEAFYLRQGATRVGRVAAPVAGTERYLPVLELEITA